MQLIQPLAPRLRALGYEVVQWEEPPSRPERSDVRFADVVPALANAVREGVRVGELRLYRHQLESIQALAGGENVILTAKTGSGKTEAWALAALREGWRVLAVYPTLALSEDQIQRLKFYYSAAGYGEDAVLRIDRPTLDRLKRRGREVITSSVRVVVTNPAFLLADLKRAATRRGYLEHFLASVDLVVFDELDFYGPRGAHLLLAMLELIVSELGAKPRVAVLTATLGNPGELAEYLKRVTGRETRIVTGRPFHPRNKYMVVLGKGIEALMDFVRAHSFVISRQAPWILELLEDPEEFKEHVMEVYEALQAMGLRPPRPGMDIVEVLRAVVEGEEAGVTIAFTRSIRAADQLYKRLVEQLPEDKRRLIAVHHHLVPRERREEVERKARRGEVRLIITVRTLAQGIDIGTVVRVIHVGLPPDLREFMQREGRKGRRESIELTESVVIPSGLWDRKLLEAGVPAMKQWMELCLEKLYINPRNAYAVIFKGLWRVIRGSDKISEEELELLKRFELVEEATATLTGRRLLGLTERGRRFWSEIGFYEHGPPYGYRRFLRRASGEVPLRGEEEVSVRDVVEKYQPGAIDPSTDYIITEVIPERRMILEETLSEALSRHKWLAEAAGKYEQLKRVWGERPDLEGDIRFGRVYPMVLLSVKAPTSGFGELLEEPLDVEWVVESRRPKLVTRPGGAARVYHETAVIELNAPCRGRYRDYTYGYIFRGPASMRPEDVELGLAALQVYLRIEGDYCIPLGLLQYRVMSAGEVRLIHLWEREAAGLLETINWAEVADRVRRFQFPEITVPLLAAIDPASALRVLKGEVPLERLGEFAARVAESIAGIRRLRAGEVVIEHPKPSREHGIVGLGLAYAQAGDKQLLAVAWTDGDETRVELLEAGRGYADTVNLASRLSSVLSSVASSGARRVYVYDADQLGTLKRLLAPNYFAMGALRAMQEDGTLREARAELEEKLRSAGLESLDPTLYFASRLPDYSEWLERALRRGDYEEAVNALKALAREMAWAAYRAALVAEKGRIVRRD